jgi:hypothetical protein
MPSLCFCTKSALPWKISRTKDRKEEKAAVAPKRERYSGKQPAPANAGSPDDSDEQAFSADPQGAAGEDDAQPVTTDDDRAAGSTDIATQTLLDDDIIDDVSETGFDDDDQGALDEPVEPADESYSGPLSLADELGVHALREIVFIDQGRLFSAAGRTAPIAELTEEEDLVLRPPDKPLSDDLHTERIEIQVDDRGILLNELGERRMFAGTKHKGRALFYLAETVPDSNRHYVGFFDTDGNLGKLYLQGRPVTTDIIYKLRVRTHDGELGVFPELSDDPDAHRPSEDAQ